MHHFKYSGKIFSDVAEDVQAMYEELQAMKAYVDELEKHHDTTMKVRNNTINRLMDENRELREGKYEEQ